MQTLTEILDSIPTDECLDRLQAKDDLRYAISMDSTIVIENFVSIWLLTPESNLAKMTTSDRQYREFLVEFWEKYRG